MNVTSLRDYPAFQNLVSNGPVLDELRPQLSPGKDEQILGRGRQACRRLKSCGSEVWGDWVDYGTALDLGRVRAMKAAGTNQPRGSKYCKEFGAFLKQHGFDLEKSTRARLLTCIEKIESITAWLATLDPAYRASLNHPEAVLRAWRNATTPKTTPAKADPTPASPAPTAALDPAAFLNASPEERAAFVQQIGFEVWIDAALSLAVTPGHEIARDKKFEVLVKTFSQAFGAIELNNDSEAANALRAAVRVLKAQDKTPHDLVFTLGRAMVGPKWGKQSRK